MLSRLLTSRELALLVGCAAVIGLGGVSYYFAQPKQSVVVEDAVRVPVPGKMLNQRTADLPPISPPAPLLRLEAKPEQDIRISVSVSGAIESPGNYEFGENARVNDAINAAGGSTMQADLSDINTAARLIDGSALVIPVGAREGVEDGKRLVIRSGQSAAALNPPEYTISGWRRARRADTSPAPSAAAERFSGTATGNGILDLNSATAEQLETLPGLGPKLAAAIVEYRSRQRFLSVDDLDNVPGFGTKRLEDIRPHVTVSAP